MTSSPDTTQSHAACVAARMLRHCCARAIVRLNGSEPDVRTIANQLRQTAELAERELQQTERRQ